jgi:predicted ATPase
LVHALFQACFVGCITRSGAALREHTDALVAVAREQKFPYNLAGGTIYRGWLLASQGHAEEGVAVLTRGLSDYRATGSSQYMSLWLCLLADACSRAGQPEEGLRHIQQALREVAATDERWIEAEVHRLRGELLATIGDRATAETCLHEAIRVACSQGAKLWELRAAVSLARLWRRQGRDGEARELLAPIHGWFAEGLDTPDLEEATALLHELGGIVMTGLETPGSIRPTRLARHSATVMNRGFHLTNAGVSSPPLQ